MLVNPALLLGEVPSLGAARSLLTRRRALLAAAAELGEQRVALAQQLVGSGRAFGLGIGLESFPDDPRLGIGPRLGAEHALARDTVDPHHADTLGRVERRM